MIKIKINIDEDNNIKIKNDKNSNEVQIMYSDKKINAIDIYNILSYSAGNQYSLETNVDDIEEEKIKLYFNDIISLINSIIDDINSLPPFDLGEATGSLLENIGDESNVGMSDIDVEKS
ncbi:MAG: hypothetical protein R3Y21_04355 [Mycoplasmatota bacterium]